MVVKVILSTTTMMINMTTKMMMTTMVPNPNPSLYLHCDRVFVCLFYQWWWHYVGQVRSKPSLCPTECRRWGGTPYRWRCSPVRAPGSRTVPGKRSWRAPYGSGGTARLVPGRRGGSSSSNRRTWGTWRHRSSSSSSVGIDDLGVFKR